MSEAGKTVLDNRYDVVRPLGSGGMGEVFLARDRVLGRDVALKVLRGMYAGDGEVAERFKREARSAASLSHPNIVQVYDRGETEEGSSYIAMEYVPGGTLKEKISKDGPLGAAEAAALGAQVTEALGAAHDRGMVHRDIKPQNVLLTGKGEAKVADFGIARAASSATISRTGSVMGTAGYMSPEQALGKPATPKSDLYSLGVVLYEALTGRLPYTADNPIAVSMKHVNEPLRPPREVDPTIPEGMNALVTKLMAKDPEDRYPGANQLADDLRRVSRGREPAAVQTGTLGSRTQRAAGSAADLAGTAPSARPAPRRRRKGGPWLLVALAALLFLLGTLAILQGVLGPDAIKGWFDVFGQNENPPATPSGPEKVRVPEVAGLTSARAQQKLRNRGLEVGELNFFPNSSVAAGRVIASGIAAGTPVLPDTAVNLDVSSGPPTVSSASASATSQPSPAPAAASAAASPAGSTASARPAGREDRPRVRRQTGAQQAPRAQQSAPPQSQNSVPPGKRQEDRGAGGGVNSEIGSNSGHGGGPEKD